MSLIPQSLESTSSKAAYLRTLPAIRERCTKVFELAQQGKLQYFEYHPDKEPAVVDFCAQIIKRDYGSNFSSIPPHGRWRHIDAGRARIDPLIAQWTGSPNPPDKKETTKRLIDLFLTSVLLDAGAGNAWSYKEKSGGKTYARSEGLGVASFAMFESGAFSSDPANPHQVNASALSQLSPEVVATSLQVNPESNPMVGIEGRTNLLVNLGKALKENTEFFGGGDKARPGNIIDFLESQAIDGLVPIAALWAALIEGLSSIWPQGGERTILDGIALGDVWPCNVLRTSTSKDVLDPESLVPFHKLTGWITYSLLEPMERVMGWKFEGKEMLTGLPEYRNGGLLLDLGLLTIRPGLLPLDTSSGLPRVKPSHPAVVEWRAVTVCQLDRLAHLIRTSLGLSEAQLTLAQVLESATWIGGREIAKIKRPDSGGPPIDLDSDGTIF